MKNIGRTLIALQLILLAACDPTRPTMAGRRWAASLHEADARLRKKAAFRLGNIGESDPEAFLALVEALHDRDPAVRREAILGILKFGAGAEAARPTLLCLCQQDKDKNVRECARQALLKLHK
jgi:HEAT repeat protein